MDKELEKNVIKSFNNVKLDVSKILTELENIKNKQNEILRKVSGKAKTKVKKVKRKAKKVKRKAKRIKKRVVKKIPAVLHKKKRKTFVAQRGGRLFHEKNCPFAQNIKPKHKIKFRSRTKALNEGYKPCKCVK